MKAEWLILVHFFAFGKRFHAQKWASKWSSNKKCLRSVLVCRMSVRPKCVYAIESLKFFVFVNLARECPEGRDAGSPMCAARVTILIVQGAEGPQCEDVRAGMRTLVCVIRCAQ